MKNKLFFKTIIATVLASSLCTAIIANRSVRSRGGRSFAASQPFKKIHPSQQTHGRSTEARSTIGRSHQTGTRGGYVGSRGGRRGTSISTSVGTRSSSRSSGITTSAGPRGGRRGTRSATPTGGTIGGVRPGTVLVNPGPGGAIRGPRGGRGGTRIATPTGPRGTRIGGIRPGTILVNPGPGGVIKGPRGGRGGTRIATPTGPRGTRIGGIRPGTVLVNPGPGGVIRGPRGPRRRPTIIVTRRGRRIRPRTVFIGAGIPIGWGRSGWWGSTPYGLGNWSIFNKTDGPISVYAHGTGREFGLDPNSLGGTIIARGNSYDLTIESEFGSKDFYDVRGRYIIVYIDQNGELQIEPFASRWALMRSGYW